MRMRWLRQSCMKLLQSRSLWCTARSSCLWLNRAREGQLHGLWRREGQLTLQILTSRTCDTRCEGWGETRSVRGPEERQTERTSLAEV